MDASVSNDFPQNRPITQRDKELQLLQGQRLNVTPHYRRCVIKMNSTFLEFVDKWFEWRGASTAMALFMITIGVAMIMLSFITSDDVIRGGHFYEDSGIIILLLGGLALLSCMAIKLGRDLLRRETFTYTHYPIRFNRKTRMVHVFRADGSVLSVKWDDVFFTLWPKEQKWQILGCVVNPSKTIALETFLLGYCGYMTHDDNIHSNGMFSPGNCVRSHWEFIRRYMETGPQSISEHVQFCLPIADQKERAVSGLHQLLRNFSNGTIVMVAVMSPFCAILALFRAYAIKTGDIPQWPKDVEAVNVIEQNDPYAIEGDAAGNRIAVFPAAARVAGVRCSKIKEK